VLSWFGICGYKKSKVKTAFQENKVRPHAGLTWQVKRQMRKEREGGQKSHWEGRAGRLHMGIRVRNKLKM
jgi:hypothetical protein